MKDISPFQRMKRLRKFMLLVCFMLLAVGILVGFMDYYQVPVADFFTLVDDGRSYTRLRLPAIMQDPPLFSMLLVWVSSLFPVKYPEIAAGVSLNILLYVMGIALLWMMARQYGTLYAGAVVLLMVTNPLSYYLVFQPLNTMLFTVYIILCLFLWQRRRYRVLFVLATLSYLVKHEAIAAIGAIALVEYFVNRESIIARNLAFLSTLPALVWELVVYVHNPQHNPYVLEIVGFADKLPNLQFLYGATVGVPFLGLTGSLRIVAFFVIGYAIHAAWAGKVVGDRTMLTVLVYAGLYALIHILFPGDAVRYGYPLFWVFAMVMALPLQGTSLLPLHRARIHVRPLLAGLIVCSVASTNALSIDAFLSKEKYTGIENKLIAGWLPPRWGKPLMLITQYPRIAEYFVARHDVVYYDFNRFPCQTIDCSLSAYGGHDRYDVFILREWSPVTSWYYKQAFQRMNNQLDQFLHDHVSEIAVVQSLSLPEKTVKLYHYRPQSGL